MGFLSIDVDEARDEIFNLIQSRRLISTKKNNSFYLYWNGFGAPAVLTSMAQVLRTRESPHPFFGTTIYIDCTRWKSKREMQRKIAEKLKLDSRTMAMFHEQDEEDDFNGVDPSSRDVILDVTAVIARTVTRSSRFTIIFLNGSDDDIPLGSFGIPEYHECTIMWTFSRRFLTGAYWVHYSREIQDKLRYTDNFFGSMEEVTHLSSSYLSALLRQEAAIIVTRYPWMRDIDLAVVIDCYLYGLLIMYHSSHSRTGFSWRAHAPNYLICDGIVRGDKAWEISNALHPEITFECEDKRWLASVLREWNEDPNIPFMVVEDHDHAYKFNRSDYCRRRISVVIQKNKKVHVGMQTVFARASSIFLATETKDAPCELPDGLFRPCNSLGVLVLSHCAFSFASPPFIYCRTLRFLGLDHCVDYNIIPFASEVECLWVIDLYYTDWGEILSKEKLELMANLMELNIEGLRWPRWTSHQLHTILPNLQRLRIIKPKYDDEAETMSSDTSDSFLVDNTSLEILDLSGSDKGTGRNLISSISQASHLEVLILDGCDASERTSTTELPPEMSRPEHRPDAYNKKGSVPKTSMVSLEGCTQLDKLFLRGLPNLVELDLSGCAIKVLDFGAMVVDVPMLKRLFLLGCESLRAIAWGSDDQQSSRRGGTLTDARLVRSLWGPIDRGLFDFNIGITSSADEAAATTTTRKEMMVGFSDRRRRRVAPTAGMYGDVTKVICNFLAPIQAFPEAPIRQLGRHIEIGEGSRNVQSEAEAPDPFFFSSRCRCRIERCPNLHAVFPRARYEWGRNMETIWVSDLLMAQCVWSKCVLRDEGDARRHLHLRRCPSLRFALAMGRQ
ncbi:hypothetical protein BS78_07G015000 [Paspalum vaginatum]|nr:hypothetical protein BS78_07G015000 [Paspalum vaginatum]